MGTTGIPITKARIGNSEFEAGRVVQQVLASTIPVVQQEVADVVLESQLPPDSPIRRQAESVTAALSYEGEVLAALTRVANEIEVQVSHDDRRMDALIRYGQLRIGVEVKLVTHTGSVATEQAINQALSFLGAGHGRDLDGMLIVTNEASTRDLERVRQHPKLRLGVWKSPSDDDVLRTALNEFNPAQ
jgi:hypothetical protein